MWIPQEEYSIIGNTKALYKYDKHLVSAMLKDLYKKSRGWLALMETSKICDNQIDHNGNSNIYEPEKMTHVQVLHLQSILQVLVFLTLMCSASGIW